MLLRPGGGGAQQALLYMACKNRRAAVAAVRFFLRSGIPWESSYPGWAKQTPVMPRSLTREGVFQVPGLFYHRACFSRVDFLWLSCVLLLRCSVSFRGERGIDVIVKRAPIQPRGRFLCVLSFWSCYCWLLNKKPPAYRVPCFL